MDPQLLAACVTAAGNLNKGDLHYTPKEVARWAFTLYDQVMELVDKRNKLIEDTERLRIENERKVRSQEAHRPA